MQCCITASICVAVWEFGTDSASPAGNERIVYQQNLSHLYQRFIQQPFLDLAVWLLGNTIYFS